MEFTGERMVPTVEGFDDLFLEHVSRYIFAARLVTGRTVLDAGCGAGYGTYHLARAGASSVLGIDVSDEAISYCRAKYAADNVSYEVRNVLETALPDDSFDTIVSFEVFEHLSEPGRFLAELRRLLKPGGVLAVSTPNVHTYVAGGEGGENEFHVKEYTPEEFEDLLRGYFPEIRWYCQGPAGGLGIYPCSSGDEAPVLGAEMRLVAPPGESTWGAPIPPRSTLHRSAYMIALCSARKFAAGNLPPAGLFTMGDDFAAGSGRLERLVENRNTLAGMVEERDRTIVELQGELESRTSWALDLKKDVDNRDETIRTIQEEARRTAEWAKAVDQERTKLHEQIQLMKNGRNRLVGNGRAGGKR